MGFRTFFIGVVEDAEPVEFCFADELLQNFKVAERLAGEADDEGGAQGDSGHGCADLFERLEKDVGAGAALHAFEHVGRGVLQGHVEIFADVVVLRDGVEQFAGDAIRIGVEEAQPAKAFDTGERFEQEREAVFDAEVFAVAGRVLADEGDFLDAACDELLCFGDDGLEAARAELAAQIGNDAEGAGMVAAFSDLDVGRCAAGGDVTRSVFVVEISRQHVRCALPLFAAEAALLFAEISFGAELVSCGCRRRIRVLNELLHVHAR